MNNKWLSLVAVLILVLLVRMDYKNQELSERIDRIEHIIINTGYRVTYTKHDVECLAKNIYYEAGIENDLGKYAVAQVTINRLKAGYWGKTVCKVVYAKAQFSWTLKKKLPKPDVNLYEKCHDIAVAALEGKGIKGLDRSLFYHADYIPTPNWVDINHYATQLGKHIFYNRARGSNLEI